MRAHQSVPAVTPSLTVPVFDKLAVCYVLLDRQHAFDYFCRNLSKRSASRHRGP